MVDIEKITPEIVERLRYLNPEKIILFGSYAYGTPNEESDLDLFIIKDTPEEKVRELRLKARQYLRDIVFKNHIGIDIIADSQKRINERIRSVKDQFYAEIMKRGKVIYAK